MIYTLALPEVRDLLLAARQILETKHADRRRARRRGLAHARDRRSERRASEGRAPARCCPGARRPRARCAAPRAATCVAGRDGRRRRAARSPWPSASPPGSARPPAWSPRSSPAPSRPRFGGSNLQVSGPTGAMTVVLIPLVARLRRPGRPGGRPAGRPGAPRDGRTPVSGRYVRFIPLPVIEGFTLGIALIIALQQVPNALGRRRRTASTCYSSPRRPGAGLGP